MRLTRSAPTSARSTSETSRDSYDVHDHLPGGGHRVGHALRDDRLAMFNNLKAFIASLPVVRIGCVGEVLAPELRHDRPGLSFWQLGYVPAASERLDQEHARVRAATSTVEDRLRDRRSHRP